MKFSPKLLKVIFYLLTLGGLIFYLILNDLLKWVIAGISVLYLMFYFLIATIAIFSISLNELGSLTNSISRKSPLMAVVLMVPTILMLWFVLLLFWPLFVIPNSSFVRNPAKYDAITNFEREVKLKYIYKRDSL